MEPDKIKFIIDKALNTAKVQTESASQEASLALRVKADEYLSKHLEKIVLKAACNGRRTVLVIATENDDLAVEVKKQLVAAGYTVDIEQDDVRDPGGYSSHTDYKVILTMPSWRGTMDP